MNNHPSASTIEHKKDHDKWHLNSRSWIGTGTTMWQGLANLYPPPSDNWISNNTDINKQLKTCTDSLQLENNYC